MLMKVLFQVHCFLTVLLGAGVAFPSAFWTLTVHSAEKNVVLVVTDDQSLDMGCYGNHVVKTPHLDSIAKDGVVFRNAFCTTASCSASRSVILTGLHNHANGHYGHQHSYHKFNSYSNIISLPVLLSKVGYRTARCGKYHVAPEKVYHFEKAIPGNSRNPVQMADNCKAFISEKSDKPFFLYFCTSDPHRGGGVRQSSPYKPNLFGNKEYPGITPVVYDPGDVIVPPFLPDTPECRAELAEYYQSISRIDQGMGRLKEHLLEAGMWDQTLFIYISDHGIAMPGAKTTVYEGGLHAPCLVRNPYVTHRGISTSGMISWVDLTPTIVDFAGGLDEKTGAATKQIIDQIEKPTPQASSQNSRAIKPGTFHGRSFLPLLTNPKAKGWDEIYASHTFHEIQMYYPMKVVREQRLKLIWNIAHPLPFPFASDLWAAPTWQAQYRKGMDAPYGQKTVKGYIHRPEFELYDLEADPHEGKNLVNDPAYANELVRLKQKLKAFQQKTSDPWIIKWEYE